MKLFYKIFFGVGFILLAVALVLNAVGVTVGLESVVGGLSVLSLVTGFLLLSVTIVALAKGRIGFSFVPLSLIFMLFEKNIAFLCKIEGGEIINNWLLLGCAILLWIGIAILFPRRRRFFRIKNRASKLGKNVKRFNFGDSVRYIDAANLTYEQVENNLSAVVVRFENADSYLGGGTLFIDNNLGSVVVEVPSSWRFTCKLDNNLGSVRPDHCAAGADAPLLSITGDNNMGVVVVKTV